MADLNELLRKFAGASADTGAESDDVVSVDTTFVEKLASAVESLGTLEGVVVDHTPVVEKTASKKTTLTDLLREKVAATASKTTVDDDSQVSEIRSMLSAKLREKTNKASAEDEAVVDSILSQLSFSNNDEEGETSDSTDADNEVLDSGAGEVAKAAGDKTVAQLLSESEERTDDTANSASDDSAKTAASRGLSVSELLLEKLKAKSRDAEVI